MTKQPQEKKIAHAVGHKHGKKGGLDPTTRRFLNIFGIMFGVALIAYFIATR
jgi:phage shock protein PspC (stress-responsive transcriptional regulator)